MTTHANPLQTGAGALPAATQLGGDPDWWRGAVIYEIYIRSFADSDDDGIGDLGGIIAHLDYIAALGVDAIWVSPFLVSPMHDFGYDVANYRDVDSQFGTLAVFDALLVEAHRRGLRVLIDLVVSHTSDQHEWFAASRCGRDNPHSDWYVWAEPGADGSPPNNWLSIFGGSAWEWDARRRQYYLHNFLISQPDLNYHNPAVQAAVLDVFEFWLRRGVDGFRLDTVNFYFHDALLRPNPPLPAGTRVNSVVASNPCSYQDPLHNISQPQNLEFLARLRQVLERYDAVTTIGEIGCVTDMYAIIDQYTAPGQRLHMAYSFDLMTEDSSAAHLRQVLGDMERKAGSGWPCWALSNHDVVRIVSRWGCAEAPGAAPLFAALLASLRGTPCFYQGEELGLPEAAIDFADLQDPYGRRFWPEYKGRDGCRTPMPWIHAEPNAGFSNARPWLPVPAQHRERAADVQGQDPVSTLNRIRRFLAWRRGCAALRKGSLELVDAPEPLLAFVREHEGQRLLCVFNLGADTARLEVNGFGGLQPSEGHGFTATLADGWLALNAYQAFFAAC